MSFNLNKLVQPECGAPNPLVAAAQQISMKPSSSASSSSSASRLYQQQQYRQIRPRLNFAQEFTSQRELTNLSRLTSNISLSSNTIPSTSSASTLSASQSQTQRQHHHQQQHEQNNNLTRPSMANPIPMNYMTMMAPGNEFNQLMRHRTQQRDSQHETSQQPTVLAGEQLETKYRNDMISQTSSSSNLNHVAEGKLDDVEFWQSLSQQYLGPATFNNIARLRAEKAAMSQSEATTSATASATTTATTTSTASASTQEFREKYGDSFDDLINDGLTVEQIMESMKWDAEGPSLAESTQSAENEYTFDDANPLKDQFEDPFSEGIKRLEQGDIPSAALLFEAAVQKEPENSSAWHYLGTTQAQNENDNSAIRALKRCLELNQDDQEARLAISVSLVNETRHHEACKYLLEWLMNHDRYKSVNANLKEFHLLDNELSNDPFYVNSIADKHYNYVRDKFMAAARQSPNAADPEVQNSLGVLFNMRGEYEKAVDCFKAALSVRSGDSLLWNRLGATLANGNKSDEAVIAYRRALEISPGFLRSRYNLAISLIHLNLYDEAAKQLVQILNMQAAGKGAKSNSYIRPAPLTSSSIWNALRTVATLLNQPNLYPIIDGRDLAKCNEQILNRTDVSSSSN